MPRTDLQLEPQVNVSELLDDSRWVNSNLNCLPLSHWEKSMRILICACALMLFVTQNSAFSQNLDDLESRLNSAKSNKLKDNQKQIVEDKERSDKQKRLLEEENLKKLANGVIGTWVNHEDWAATGKYITDSEGTTCSTKQRVSRNLSISSLTNAVNTIVIDVWTIKDDECISDVVRICTGRYQLEFRSDLSGVQTELSYDCKGESVGRRAKFNYELYKAGEHEFLKITYEESKNERIFDKQR